MKKQNFAKDGKNMALAAWDLTGPGNTDFPNNVMSLVKFPVENLEMLERTKAGSSQPRKRSR